MKHYKEIKLNNKTKFRSDDLSKLFQLCYLHYHRLNNVKFSWVGVLCIYRRVKDGFCGGYAYYNHNHITMKLPKDKRPYGHDSFEQRLARTFLHELDHCRGLTHGGMMNDTHRNLSFLPSDIQVREYALKVKQIPTVNTKLESLFKRKAKWESKIKRGQTAIKKINRQVKYYERKTAAISPN